MSFDEVIKDVFGKFLDAILAKKSVWLQDCFKPKASLMEAIGVYHDARMLDNMNLDLMN
jgi:hypothetical protein